MFNPRRLTLARERRGMTKTALAVAIRVDLRSVTRYESGAAEPQAETVSALARVLEFPAEFFSGEDIEMPEDFGISFRSMAGMTASQRNAAIGAATLAVALDDWISMRFDRPAADLPPLSGQDPESAADALRTMWGIGEGGVPNVVRQLEAHGVRVFSLAEQSREVDAFSFWRDGTPYVFLNMQKSAEHGRMDAAHELGHLVMHRHGGPKGGTAEHEANSFASAFLVPRGSLLAHAPRVPDVNSLISLKRRWGVSVAALNYRLHSCGLISDWHYRTVCIKIAKLGYRLTEPDPAPRETSRVLQSVFKSLQTEGIRKTDVAAELRIDPAELDGLIFGLVMTRLPGGKPEQRQKKHKLRSV